MKAVIVIFVACLSVAVSAKRVKKQQDCNYGLAEISECENGTRTRTRKLISGISTCNATVVYIKKCQQKKTFGKGCKYEKKDWTECDTVSDTRTREFLLKKGSPDNCQPTKSISVSCGEFMDHKKKKNGCKYNKWGEWGACDPTTNVRTTVIKAKGKWKSHCDAIKIVSAKCQDIDMDGKKSSPKDDKELCQYQTTSVGECDETTNKAEYTFKVHQARTPDWCPQTKTIFYDCVKPKKSNGKNKKLQGKGKGNKKGKKWNANKLDKEETTPRP